MKRLSFFMFLFSIAVSIAQQHYYVAANGDDSNNGSSNSPWKTIQYGINQLQAGDLLNIKAGTYTEKLEIDVSGTDTNYITIRNYQNDEVIIDGSGINNDASLLWTDNAYLRIQGLHFTNNIGNDREGITLQGSAHHIEIINNKISNIKYTALQDNNVTYNENAVPLNVYADSPTDSIHNILIKGNEVFNNVTGYSENISAGGNFSTFIIEDNILHDNTNIGIDIGGNYEIGNPSALVPPELNHGRYGVIRNNVVYNCNSPYSTAAGIYIDGGRNIIVENNVCFHNGYGGEIGCEQNGDTSNIIFRNNIFYENYYNGMHIGAYDPSQPSAIVKNVQIYNNTFYFNDTGFNEIGEFNLTKSVDCKIMNNIFYVSNQNIFFTADRTQQNLSIDYNLVYNDSGANALITYGNYEYTGLQNLYNATGFGMHSSYSDPKFINVSENDFHIMDTSPAIDAGDPNFTSTTGNINIPGIVISNVDMDGQTRVKNIVDCGADESTVTLGIRNFDFQSVSIFPNPTNNTIFLPKEIQQGYYQIFSSSGKIISKGRLHTNSIDLIELHQGLYFILLQDKTTIYTFKVLKLD